MRPISLAVDVTNHVMLELGQPLHAFDLDALAGDVVVRRAAPGERLTTLDGQDRALDRTTCSSPTTAGRSRWPASWVAARPRVTAGTTSLLLESAHFAPRSIARTARRHRLPSEASRRYERGVDPALGPAAAEAAVRLLVQLGGAAAGPLTDVDARVPLPAVALPVTEPERLAGRPYAPEVVRRRLEDVGCTVSGGPDVLEVVPPSWRPT
jgi:phenylalanyl-tRNA synthetase beta chain